MQYFNFYKDIDILKSELDLFKISKKLSHPLLMLAPMAGYTDLPFRSVVKDFGVDISVSEMISSHALVYENDKTLRMTQKSDNEAIYSLQISGSNKSILQQCVEKINKLDFVDIIDFNCGCPAPKVANHGNGSALLKNLDLFIELLKLIRKNSNKNVFSVKVRLGFDKKIPIDLAHAINESGVDFCVVHARTKADAYKRDRIDYECVARMKEILKIPLIANGEIDSISTYEAVKNITNCDGVMIGRAALKAPWIFWQIRNNSSIPPLEIKKKLVLTHLNKMHEFYGDRGIVMFRKNLHAYAKGRKDSSSFRDFVNSTTDISVLRDSINEFFSDEVLSVCDISPSFNLKSV